MAEENFYYKLAKSINSNDCDITPNEIVMSELGDIIAEDKNSFVDVLKNAGIQSSYEDEITDLIDKFIENAPKNDKLLIGVSLMIGYRNMVSNSDGESELSDAGIKATYRVMYEHFDNLEDTSNWVGSIAKAVGEGANLGSKIVEGKNQKKYGSQIQLSKQQEARKQLIQSVLEKKEKDAILKQKESDRKSKNIRVLLITGGLIITCLIGLGLYFKFKK